MYRVGRLTSGVRCSTGIQQRQYDMLAESEHINMQTNEYRHMPKRAKRVLAGNFTRREHKAIMAYWFEKVAGLKKTQQDVRDDILYSPEKLARHKAVLCKAYREAVCNA